MGDASSPNSFQGQTVLLGVGTVFCSICLDAVKDGGERSIAKLKCGHHFHLDCIGSAFNAKGSMQCPNCRSVEEGQWLYANGARRMEEFSVDGIEYDAFELFTGIINVLRPNDELHSRHHQSSSFLPHHHISVVLEGANSQPRAFADLLVHVLQNRDDIPSNSVHESPHLGAQRMAFDDNVGPSYGRSESSPSLQSRRHSGNPPRMQAISSPERGTWGSGAAGNFRSRSVANLDTGTSMAFPYERRRWSGPGSSNPVAANSGGSSLQFGQTGASRRYVPHSSRGSIPFHQNVSNHGQRANAPAVHTGSMDHNRRPRHREWPTDMFPERARHAHGFRRHTVRENASNSPGSGREWQGNIHGSQWSRDGQPSSYWSSYASERYWNPHQHFSSPQAAESTTSDTFLCDLYSPEGLQRPQAAESAASDTFLCDLYGHEGLQQTQVELRNPFEEYLDLHSHMNPSTGFPALFVRDSSVEPVSPYFRHSFGP